MQLKAGLLRLLRIGFVAGAAWLAFRWLEPQGYGWVVGAVAALIALLWLAWRVRGVRRARAEDRQVEAWTNALMHPPLRPQAIGELRAALAELDADKDAPRHAHLSLVLAEILEADGDAKLAFEALGEVHDVQLTESFAAVVRHARAVAALSMGAPDKAREALDALPGRVGDRNIDLKIELIRGLVAVEEGDANAALELAEQVRDEAGSDADLRSEARVLKAVAIEALGDPKDAVKVMSALDDDILEVLSKLGLPRVRKLADRTLEARDS